MKDLIAAGANVRGYNGTLLLEYAFDCQYAQCHYNANGDACRQWNEVIDILLKAGAQRLPVAKRKVTAWRCMNEFRDVATDVACRKENPLW